ncbi:MAG: N(4)-(beta-N-acetylglucosaminyl)-L-asparaginase [Pyrinomonadaceae bacterium]|nr:N(4)-(beta-N-acetylglucosaminyl)-L-asparaginase [Pyrinomonadaceae bacterium]MBP6212781.1 N(4)-(beta-N-acetylglucosaminyl)-L-asparaginase [Pyrinomonadaceae bacterium]
MTNRRDFIRNAAIGLPLLAATGVSGQRPSKAVFNKPLVVSTWDSGFRANAAAWKVLEKSGKAIDAVEQAARSAEDEVSCCVGLDAFPDRDGFVTLDASIMDERSNCGSVLFLQHIKNPISVARKVMETDKHVALAGDGALQFALANGFERRPQRLSPDAEKAWKEWLKESEYKPVINIENAKPGKSNGPSAPLTFPDGRPNHDTMGTIALDANGDLSGACTTSGMAFKMHGRVGDSPIIGAGLFVDNTVGAATSSGVGEEVIRICGTHLVIELMRFGYSPEKACAEAVRRVVERDPKKAKLMQVGFIAIAKNGEVGAFAIQKGFTYSVTNAAVNKVLDSKSYFK